MVQKKEYRSAARSRRLIREAFQALLREKDFERITITDIVNRADLNRSTFYAHYPDIYAVVEEIQDEMVQRNVSLIEQTPYRDILRNPKTYLDAMTAILRENMELLQRLGHTAQLHTRLDSFRRLMVNDILQSSDIPELLRRSPEFEIRVHFFIGGIMNTYQQWAEGKISCSLEEISEEIAVMIQKSGADFL